MRLLYILALLSFAIFAKESLLIFAGSASKPATQEIAKKFEKENNVTVDIVFGGSGYVLSQMKLTRRGDIYFPGSSDYMEIAKKQDLVDANSQKIVVYLVSAINVQKGNPKNIHSLADLAKSGIRVAIANPEGVCVGSFAVEIIEKSFNKKQKEQFRKNLVNYTASCAKTANAISLKQVDAVIGWRVFEYWNSKLIETIPLKESQIVRVGYIPIAISKFSKNKALAAKFIDYITSKEAKEIFAKYHYLSTPEEAFKYIGSKKDIGGVYKVPKDWLNR
jgi:molybdate transport system substrate-binding protein